MTPDPTTIKQRIDRTIRDCSMPIKAMVLSRASWDSFCEAIGVDHDEVCIQYRDYAGALAREATPVTIMGPTG